ncbi:hypothetical protein RZN22_17970 [Bacillaceae bacterium S4-13-58]
MYRHFDISCTDHHIVVRKIVRNPIFNIRIYAGHQLIAHLISFEQIVFYKELFRMDQIFIQGDVYTSQGIFPIKESFILDDFMRVPAKDVSYKPGDLLIASDNQNGLPAGYMGHSAMVVDEEHAIDSVASSPIVRKIPISHFLESHPQHAHYRPKSEEMGQKAVNYALNYLKKFKENKENGIDKPKFYFSLQTPLKDEWTYIYCSKLIWLSYYYGADYEFPNDHLWFAPEDIYNAVKENPNFEKVSIHPEFGFNIDI